MVRSKAKAADEPKAVIDLNQFTVVESDTNWSRQGRPRKDNPFDAQLQASYENGTEVGNGKVVGKALAVTVGSADELKAVRNALRGAANHMNLGASIYEVENGDGTVTVNFKAMFPRTERTRKNKSSENGEATDGFDQESTEAFTEE